MHPNDRPNIPNPITAPQNRQFQVKIEEHQPQSPTIPKFKRKFPSILQPINTDYAVETYYQASSFQNSFELLKKVIIDLAGDKEENCEFDIIVKKRKITKNEPQPSFNNQMFESLLSNRQQNLQPPEQEPAKPSENQNILEENHINNKEAEEGSSYSSENDSKEERKELPNSLCKQRHKNCPKLFGRAIFNLILNNKEFQQQHLQESDFEKKIEEINYPKNAEIKLSEFIAWIKREKFHEKYTNLRIFRDVWSWRNISNENWLEKHYKYYLTKLMKVFFESFAYTYIFDSNIQQENGKDYLHFIPKFLNGIEYPESFYSLKE